MIEDTPATLPFAPLSDRDADAIAAHQARQAVASEARAAAVDQTALPA